MQTPPPERPGRGFTLLEALMALLVLTLAMLLGYGFMMRQPQAMKRLDAGDEALRAIEASLETIRSGAIPVQPSRMLQPVIAYPPPTTAADLLIDLEVEPTETPGLFAVSLEARYRVGRSIHRRHVQSLVWSP